MSIVLAPGEKHRECPLEQVDGPLASSALVPAQSMGDLVQVGDDRKFSAQNDGVGAWAVGTAAAVAAVQRSEGQGGLLGEEGAKILMERRKLELSFIQRSAIRLVPLEPFDGGDNAGLELHRWIRISLTLAG